MSNERSSQTAATRQIFSKLYALLGASLSSAVVVSMAIMMVAGPTGLA